MRSMQLRVRVGSDGKLRMEIPVWVTNVELDVVVIVQPVATNGGPSLPDGDRFPPTFFERRIDKTSCGFGQEAG